MVKKCHFVVSSRKKHGRVVLKVNGLHCDVRVKGVLIEHDSATSEMNHVEVVCEGRVLEVLNRFLKSDGVRFHRNVLFNGTFSASSTPRIPVQYAEACLLKQTVGPVVVETVLRFRGREPPVVGTTENRIGAS